MFRELRLPRLLRRASSDPPASHLPRTQRFNPTPELMFADSLLSYPSTHPPIYPSIYSSIHPVGSRLATHKLSACFLTAINPGQFTSASRPIARTKSHRNDYPLELFGPTNFPRLEIFARFRVHQKRYIGVEVHAYAGRRSNK